MSKWIECSDKLPSDLERVRIAGYRYNKMGEGFWTTEAFLRDDGEWYEELDDSEPLSHFPPTHWQKLGPDPTGLEADSIVAEACVNSIPAADLAEHDERVKREVCAAIVANLRIITNDPGYPDVVYAMAGIEPNFQPEDMK